LCNVHLPEALACLLLPRWTDVLDLTIRRRSSVFVKRPNLGPLLIGVGLILMMVALSGVLDEATTGRLGARAMAAGIAGGLTVLVGIMCLVRSQSEP
jgi:hypothetical protein